MASICFVKLLDFSSGGKKLSQDLISGEKWASLLQYMNITEEKIEDFLSVGEINFLLHYTNTTGALLLGNKRGSLLQYTETAGEES